ncbi:MAG: SDR family oxidoreductase [Cytophagaceae bacterium]
MNNKVIIITGGSSGIGFALAEKFGKEGSKVVITGRDNIKLFQAADKLRIKGIKVVSVVADSSLEEDNARVIYTAIKEFGKVDVLINNAGITMRALFEESEVDVLKKVMDINFYGTVYATKYALPEIIKNQGSIVGVSSIAGMVGLPGRTGYSASKFAMQGFLESIRIENLKKGIHVLLACPGFTTSNIRKMALGADGNVKGESSMDEDKMMTAEEVADRIYDAVVKRKRELILTRQGKLTVLLKKFLPGVVDKIVYNHFIKEKDSPLK